MVIGFKMLSSCSVDGLKYIMHHSKKFKVSDCYGPTIIYTILTIYIHSYVILHIYNRDIIVS